MGIHHHRTGDPVKVSQQQVRRFAPDPRQLQQLFHAVGYFPAVLVQQDNGALDNVPGLGAEKAAGMDQFLYFGDVGFGKGLQRRKAGEERGGNLIHPFIRTLGGEPDGEQQFIILPVIQGTDGFRIFRQQTPDDFIDLFLCAHQGNSFQKSPACSGGAPLYCFLPVFRLCPRQRLTVMPPPHSMVVRSTPL